ncbi:MAG: FHA domain-containing protein [Mycobacteriaceae bacterium]|nr:FHA domain-containing protein [Mycobacteriaceae bacterium]
MRRLRSLPPQFGGLAGGVPPAPSGTLYALTPSGGVVAEPVDGAAVVFGRNRDVVDVCVGRQDRAVSRLQGSLIHRDRSWWIGNAGLRPLRLPGSRLVFADEEPVPLELGYTPVFVRGTGEREHLLEVYVVGPEDTHQAAAPADLTMPTRAWRLSDTERLAVVALAQRYLLQDPHPQPVSWRQAAVHLAELEPAAGWNAKRVERVVEKVRLRMSAKGVAGLTREEVGEPVGNTLNHNLIRELMDSAALKPADLSLLDSDEP